jgi:hypothetical protein
MKRKPLAIVSITSLAVSVLLVRPAQAETVAGWDFSQWAGDAALITDGTTPTFRNTLEANYSSLDPSDGAGAESAAFGTLYFDGNFGSTSVDELAYPPDFTPTAAAAGSLDSNLEGPVAGGGPQPFNSFTILESEGQDFAQDVAMTAAAPLSVVFQADRGSPPPVSHHWELSLGGRTFDGSSDVEVEFSTDGVSYSPMTTFHLTSTDTRFSAPLMAAVTDTAFVRLSLDPLGGQPMIDNVAVVLLPEPDLPLQVAASLVTLAVLHRVRRRR